MRSDAEQVTLLLRRWRDGDDAALATLLAQLQDELRAVARRAFTDERPGHTLQPTAVLNEALVRMFGMNVAWQDRGHFLAVSAVTMRRVLVDHARARQREKRGGGAVRVTLTTGAVAEGTGAGAPPDPALLDLDAALDALAEIDERKARITELHYFGGLTYAELARELGLAEATVHRDLVFARAWLKDRLADGG